MKTDLLLLEFYETKYKPLRLIGAAQTTISQYRYAIGWFGKFLGKPPMLSDLTEENVCAMMARIIATGGTPTTANSKAAYLKTLARFARRKKYIEHDLSCVDRLRVQKRVPTAWTVDDMERLIQSCRQCAGWVQGVPAAIWWEMLVLVAFDTGIRRRALLNVGMDWLDLQRGTLCVPGEYMKNATEQFFKLSHQTIEVICKSIPPQRDKLFSWPAMCPKTFYGGLGRILERAGLPNTRRDKLHRIRRTTASHVAAKYDEGRAIKQLGHLDASCIKRYIDPTFTNQHDATAALPRPAWENPREVVVEPAALEPAPIGEPLVLALSKELAAANSPIARLLDGEPMTPPILDAAIGQTGLPFYTFASLACVSGVNLRRVLSGERPITREMDRRLRAGLALAMRRYSREPETAGVRGDAESLQADPVCLLPEFFADELKTCSSVHRRTVKRCLSLVLLWDGARQVTDLRPEADLSEIDRRVAAGEIHVKTACYFRAALRRYLQWLASAKGIRGFERAIYLLGRRSLKKEGAA